MENPHNAHFSTSILMVNHDKLDINVYTWEHLIVILIELAKVKSSTQNKTPNPDELERYQISREGVNGEREGGSLSCFSSPFGSMQDHSHIKMGGLGVLMKTLRPLGTVCFTKLWLQKHIFNSSTSLPILQVWFDGQIEALETRTCSEKQTVNSAAIHPCY